MTTRRRRTGSPSRVRAAAVLAGAVLSLGTACSGAGGGGPATGESATAGPAGPAGPAAVILDREACTALLPGSAARRLGWDGRVRTVARETRCELAGGGGQLLVQQVGPAGPAETAYRDLCEGFARNESGPGVVSSEPLAGRATCVTDPGGASRLVAVGLLTSTGRVVEVLLVRPPGETRDPLPALRVVLREVDDAL